MQAELPSLPRVGDVIDRYRVILAVAHGGMAAVYAVQRSSVGGFEKVHAVKVLLPNLAADQHFVNMFLDEARIASQIQHPNVVHVLDVGHHERLPYLLMEFLRGQSLARVLRRAKQAGRALPPGFCLGVLARAAAGLHAAHETKDAEGQPLGVIHRDVSPHNIFVGYDGQVKVVDFGIAAARGRLVGTRTGELKGKLAYLAPETLHGLPVTRQADVWALGVVGWEALAGKRLFAKKDEATTMWSVLNAPIEDLAQLVPSLPQRATDTIMSCLKRGAAQRLRDAHQIAEALAAAFAESQGGQIEACVASTMDEMFAEERGVERERLAAAMRTGAPLPLKEPEPTSDVAEDAPAPAVIEEASATQLDATANLRPRGSRRVAVAATIAVLLIVAGGATWGWQRGWLRSPESNPVAAAGEEPELHSIQINIDPRARSVLVDGTPHDERPVRVRLGRAELIAVEVTGEDGSVVRRKIGVKDDGVLIALPTAKPEPSPSESAAPEASVRLEKRAATRGPKPRKREQPPSPKTPPPAKKPEPLLTNPF